MSAAWVCVIRFWLFHPESYAMEQEKKSVTLIAFSSYSSKFRTCFPLEVLSIFLEMALEGKMQ